MTTASRSLRLVLPALAAATFAVATAARAADNTGETSESPAASAASAASPSSVHRRLKMRQDHTVPSEFTLAASHAPIADGFKTQVRFAGQAQMHECTLKLPKAGETVQPGSKAVVTIQCATPWEVYDNGLGYDAFEGGKKIGSGTVRP